MRRTSRNKKKSNLTVTEFEFILKSGFKGTLAVLFYENLEYWLKSGEISNQIKGWIVRVVKVLDSIWIKWSFKKVLSFKKFSNVLQSFTNILFFMFLLDFVMDSGGWCGFSDHRHKKTYYYIVYLIKIMTLSLFYPMDHQKSKDERILDSDA